MELFHSYNILQCANAIVARDIQVLYHYKNLLIIAENFSSPPPPPLPPPYNAPVTEGRREGGEEGGAPNAGATTEIHGTGLVSYL